MADGTAIELNNVQMTARELTVRECEWLLEHIEGDVHPLEAMCPDEPIPAKAIAKSVDVSMDWLDSNWKDLSPSQVKQLFTMVREKNPFLARSVEALAEVGRRILDEESKTSEGPAAG